MTGRTEPARDMAAIMAVSLLAVIELWIHESYHRISSESVGLVAVLVSTPVALLLAQWSYRLQHRRWGHGPGRLAVLLVAVVAVGSIAGDAIRQQWATSGVPLRSIGCLVLLGLLLSAVRAPGQQGDGRWRQVRLAIVVSFVLFVLSEPIFVQLRAPSLRWFPEFSAADARADAGKRVTLVLLLDELNANATGPLENEFSRRGIKVAQVAVPSIGDSTANVVPTMFDGREHVDGRPCGRSAICSGNQVLDFSRISVARPDVDVVGFFHPYCEMQGLRSCMRASIALALFDPQRWKCAWYGRIQSITDAHLAGCGPVYLQRWSDMVDAVVEATRVAPTLSQGGLLFAHLPLPHPPGVQAEQTLPQHYRANVQRVAELLGDMLDRAHSNQLEVQALIFSDHPLRQRMWCTGFNLYRWQGCQPDPALEDDRVPILVAGQRLPDLSAIKSNAQPFKLVPAFGR